MDRKVRLKQLIGSSGGATALAKKLNYANASFLVQMAGPNPTREISEKWARNTEAKLGLESGWFDQSIETNDSADAVNILREVINESQRLGISIPTPKIPDLVGFVIKHSATANDKNFLQELLLLFK